jgi:hypothetical protein
VAGGQVDVGVRAGVEAVHGGGRPVDPRRRGRVGPPRKRARPVGLVAQADPHDLRAEVLVLGARQPPQRLVDRAVAPVVVPLLEEELGGGGRDRRDDGRLVRLPERGRGLQAYPGGGRVAHAQLQLGAFQVQVQAPVTRSSCR